MPSEYGGLQSVNKIGRERKRVGIDTRTEREDAMDTFPLVNSVSSQTKTIGVSALRGDQGVEALGVKVGGNHITIRPGSW